MHPCLSQTPVGKSVVIHRLTATGDIRRRLLDLGFTPGARVTCLLVAPGGDLRAYGLHGTAVALRNTDAEHVELSPCH